MSTQASRKVYLDPTALRAAVARLGLGYEALIERLRPASPHLVSDVYALQQIVYEHHLEADTEHGYYVSELVQSVLSEVYPVTYTDVLRSRWLASEHPNLQARERLHLAIMRNHRVNALVTAVPDRYRYVDDIEHVPLRTLLADPDASGTRPAGHGKNVTSMPPACPTLAVVDAS